MHVTTRFGLRRIGGAALAVATAAALIGLPGTAYAAEMPAPVAESPAPAEPAQPAPADPAPSDPAQPAPADPAPADPAPAEPAPADPAPSDPAPAEPADPAPEPSTAAPVPPGPTAAPRIAAEAESADLSVTLRGTTLAAGTGGKFAQVVIANDGPSDARDVVLEVAFTPGTAPNRAELDMEGLCDVTRTPNVYRCELGDLAHGQTADFPIPVAPAAGAAATPDAGTLAATVTSATADPDTADNSATATITIAGNGPDIVLVAIDPTLVPGRAGMLFGLLANFGDRSSGPVAVDFTLPAGVTVPAEMVAETGCAVSADRASLSCMAPAHAAGQASGFLLPVQVAEDAGLGRVFPGGTAVASDAPTLRTVNHSAGSPARTANIFRPATEAEAAALTGDVDGSDNSDTFAVRTTDEVVALSVEVAPVRAAKGATVEVPYVVRNAGPDAADLPDVLITAPTGTEFVATDTEDCEPGEDARELWCYLPSILPAGAEAEGTVRLRVTGATVGKDGTVEVDSAFQYDSTRADNSARIVVLPPVTESLTEGRPPLTQGRLPVTGASVGLAGTAGLLMLLGGAGLVVAARRRTA